MVEFKLGDLVEHKESGRHGIVIKDDQTFFPRFKSVHFRDDSIEAVCEADLVAMEKPTLDRANLAVGDLVYALCYNRYAEVVGFRDTNLFSVQVRRGKQVYEEGYWDVNYLFVVEKAKKPTLSEPKFQVGDRVGHRVSGETGKITNLRNLKREWEYIVDLDRPPTYALSKLSPWTFESYLKPYLEVEFNESDL
jgi:heat shock protein HspQ